MADTLKFRKGTESKLPSAENGQVLFTTDTNKLYVDDGSSHKLVAGNAVVDITRNGTTFTMTKLDGTTDTFTQQDDNTTYSAGTGISISNTTINNSGVRSVATGSGNGTISVNTNGTAADVAVKNVIHTGNIGSQSVNYANSAGSANAVAWGNVSGKPSTYPPESHTHSYLPLSGGTLSGPIYVHNSNMTISAGKIEQYGGAPYGGLFSNGVAFTNPTTQNDAAWLRITGTSENDTVFEIAVGDDGNNNGATVEEIVVRQYGTDNAVNRQITLLDKSGNSHFRAAYGAVWNDYAEFRSQDEHIEPGYCVTSSRSGKVSKTVERLQYCEGIVSDTFGFAIGETSECKTPLAVSGRVLAYYNGNIEDYDIGDVVCAGPEGKVCKMSREEIKEYPDRIVGTISEFPSYEFWGDGKAPTKGRIWIKLL